MMYKSQYNSLRADEYHTNSLFIKFKTMEIYNESVQWFNKQENPEMHDNNAQGFIIGLW